MKKHQGKQLNKMNMMTLNEKIAIFRNDILNIIELFQYELNNQKTRDNIILEIRRLVNPLNVIVNDVSDNETIYNGHILLAFSDLDKDNDKLETLHLYF